MHAKVYYEDFPQCDSSDIAAAASDIVSYCSLSELTNDPFSAPTYNYAAWEESYMDVDGDYIFCTESTYTQEYISNSFTNSYGYFAANPVITITLAKTISTSGIGIYQLSNIGEDPYMVSLTIKWFRNGVQIASESTYIDDDESGYIYKTVEDYNKITVEITRYCRDGSFVADVSRRARLYKITLGQTEVFENDNLFAVNLDLKTSLTSEQIESDTGNIVVVAEDRFFQAGQKISIYYNDRIISVQYIDTAERNGSKYSLNTISLTKYLSDTFMVPEGENYVISNELYKTVFQTLEGTVPTTIYDTTNKYSNGIKVIDENINMTAATRVKGKISKRLSKKDALVYLCLAAAALIYEKSGNLYIKKMYTQADISTLTPKFVIPENNVFSGDKHISKSPYKYIEMTTVNDYGVKSVTTTENTSNRATATSKKISTEITPNSEYMNKLNEALKWYYFKPDFYNAKAKIPITKENYMLYPGDYVKINGIDCIAETVKLNLSGNIVIADAVYKVV